jgi:CRP/FNR family transcriptional regulator, cyclic AMP receptor protein
MSKAIAAQHEGAQLSSLLDPEAVETLKRLAKAMSFASGEVLMHQGRAARGAFFIESGEVEARVALPGGGDLPVARLGPGSVLGEMALIEQGVVSATVVARAEVRAQFVERDDFRALVAQRDAAVMKLQHAVAMVLAQKLRALNARVLACDAPEDAPAEDEPAGDPLAGVQRTESASFDYRRFLSLLPVFREFGEDDIERVAATAKLLELERGHGIFAAGQPVACSWIVVRGAVEVSARRAPPVAGGEATRRRIAVLGPGQWVGAMSQLDGAVHGSSGRARENSLLLEIGRAEFNALYRSGNSTSARIQRALHASLLQSLRHTNNQLSRLISQARVRGRRDGVPVKELQSALYGQLCHAAG